MRINTKAYSDYELTIIEKLWPTATHQDILSALPGRTSCGIRQKATLLGLAIDVVRVRKGDLAPIVSGTPEAWYWLGFFLADGHITKDGQFVVGLSDKDEDHLERLAIFLKTEVKRPCSNPEIIYSRDKKYDRMRGDAIARSQVRITVMDKVVCARIWNILGLNSTRKTYNPPDLEVISRLEATHLEWLFMGFFDGDGHSGLRWATMELHGAWRPFLVLLAGRGLVGQERPHSIGHEHVCVGIPVATLRRLYAEHASVLPLMERKWQRWAVSST